jgi:UMP-CMP kinase
MDANEETMIDRITERSKTSGRNDDNIESLKKRFATFRNETMPIVDLYETMGKCRKVNGLRSIDEVFADLETIFAGFI